MGGGGWLGWGVEGWFPADVGSNPPKIGSAGAFLLDGLFIVTACYTRSVLGSNGETCCSPKDVHARHQCTQRALDAFQPDSPDQSESASINSS